MKGPRRRKGRRKPAPPRGMCWVLRLEQNEFGDYGYFCLAGPDGITVRKQPGGLMQRFITEEDARRTAQWLRKTYKIDDEHVTPELLAHETEASFWLTRDKWADGVSIETDETNGRRYLLVREDSEEFTTEEIDDNVADAFVRLFREDQQAAWSK